MFSDIYSDLTFIGWASGREPVQNEVLKCWHNYLSGASCKDWHVVQLMPLTPRHLVLYLNSEWVICILITQFVPGKEC